MATVFSSPTIPDDPDFLVSLLPVPFVFPPPGTERREEEGHESEGEGAVPGPESDGDWIFTTDVPADRGEGLELLTEDDGEAERFSSLSARLGSSMLRLCFSTFVRFFTRRRSVLSFLLPPSHTRTRLREERT